MRKIFLYLYPISDYFSDYISIIRINDKNNDSIKLEKLNTLIEERYRQKGYEIIYALFPDRDMYGTIKTEEDKIIYADVDYNTFNVLGAKYPDEKYLIDQIGKFDKIVVGGFHFSDCVKRIAKYCSQKGYPTLIDLELTNLFFLICNDPYLIPSTYNPYKFEENLVSTYKKDNPVYELLISDPIYGFTHNRNI